MVQKNTHKISFGNDLDYEANMIKFVISEYVDDFTPTYYRIYEKQILLHEFTESDLTSWSNTVIVSKYYNDYGVSTDIGNDENLFYKVIAGNDDDSKYSSIGQTDTASIISLSAPPNAIPEPPTNLSITVGQNELKLEWENKLSVYEDDDGEEQTKDWTSKYNIYGYSAGDYDSGSNEYTEGISEASVEANLGDSGSWSTSNTDNTVYIASTSGTSYTHSGLNDNTIYAYRIYSSK